VKANVAISLWPPCVISRMFCSTTSVRSTRRWADDPAETDNGENIILERKDVAERYLANWDAHWSKSKPYDEAQEPVVDGPISPVLAIQRKQQLYHVRMRVTQAYSLHGFVYLNYSLPYDDPQNLAIRVCPNSQPPQFKDWASFEKHLLNAVAGKEIEVIGEVKPYMRHY
jgi:hypothetical protein